MAKPVILLLLLILHGGARSRLEPYISLHQPPYTEREKNHMNIAICLLLPMAGIEPGPSAQQARALSIVPLPLSSLNPSYYYQ